MLTHLQHMYDRYTALMDGVKRIGGNKSMSFHPTTRLTPPAGTHTTEQANLWKLWGAMVDSLNPILDPAVTAIALQSMTPVKLAEHYYQLYACMHA